MHGKELRFSVQSSNPILVDRYVLARLCDINQQDALFCVKLFQFQQPVNITHDFGSCYLYTFDPPDDEQQACSKHVEASY